MTNTCHPGGDLIPKQSKSKPRCDTVGLTRHSKTWPGMIPYYFIFYSNDHSIEDHYSSCSRCPHLDSSFLLMGGLHPDSLKESNILDLLMMGQIRGRTTTRKQCEGPATLLVCAERGSCSHESLGAARSWIATWFRPLPLRMPRMLPPSPAASVSLPPLKHPPFVLRSPMPLKH
jgi:hypothetical protein